MPHHREGLFSLFLQLHRYYSIGKQFCSYISQNVGGGVFGRSLMMCSAPGSRISGSLVAVAGKAQLTTEYTLRPQPTTEAAVLTTKPILLHIVARVLHTLTYSLSSSLHSATAGLSHWVPGWGGSVGGRIGSRLHKIQATGGRSGCKRGKDQRCPSSSMLVLVGLRGPHTPRPT